MRRGFLYFIFLGMKLVFRAVCCTVAAALGMCSGVSCVDEDRSDCPPVFAETLKVVFSPRPTDLVIPQGRLHRVALYVFDRAGRVSDVWRADDVVFGEIYDTGIVPRADTCELVAWVSSPDEPFDLTPPPAEAVGSGVNLSQARLELAVPPTGVVNERLPWLFYGTADELTGEMLSGSVGLVLTPDSYVIRLSVTGLPDDGSVYRFTIRDNNGAYDFRNNCLESGYFTYSSESRVVTRAGTGVLTASLTTLRIDASRSPGISLVNTATGQDIFPADRFGTDDLVRIIRDSRPDTDFETEHRYDIEISCIGTSVELRVNGWALKPQDFDVKP
jgi:hypothetical protein